ncbi:MAG: hypothetical protein RL693_478 [Verrucomicrobiota bacterium]|jgi:ElaB/YqjD/DUF883 family membrane-anchored ribosome-binding protein
MKNKLDSLLDQMQVLEQEVWRELKKNEQEFFYEVRQGKVRFTEEARARHKKLVKRFSAYVRDSRFWIIATAPVIWACLIPIVMVDAVMILYQAICFPIYNIPRVRRADYVKLDRHRLSYLNWAEKINCEYCSYVNGVLACASEVAARTEQFWCPIKHALRMKSMHSRYRFFFEYGDAETYRRQIETVRRSFEDIEPTEVESDAPLKSIPP